MSYSQYEHFELSVRLNRGLNHNYFNEIAFKRTSTSKNAIYFYAIKKSDKKYLNRLKIGYSACSDRISLFSEPQYLKTVKRPGKHFGISKIRSIEKIGKQN